LSPRGAAPRGVDRAAVAVSVVALLVACGGTSTGSGLPSDAGAEASPSSDAGPGDAAVADAGPAAGACATTGTASKCILCCERAFPNAGVEVAFAPECAACSSSCSGKAPCGADKTLAADAGCVKCLSPKLGPGASGWPQCQASAACAGFAACFATCSTL
jgi:hypothetical protein